MNITFAFKNFEPSDHLRRYAKRRFEKLGRFLPKSENVEITVTLAVDKFRHQADVQLSGDHLNITAVEQSEDMYATVDMILDKLQSQIKKHAEKAKDRRRSGKEAEFGAEDYEAVVELPDRLIVQTDDFVPKPLHLDEAALQLESATDHQFLVFCNAENNRVNVLYRRKNGDFGLIDPGR